MQDLQGLGDLGTGIHLAIHAHQKGPVQQYSCMLCKRDTVRQLWKSEDLPKDPASGWGNSPWQSRVYSGRFLRAVCTTSKSRLPRQYIKVGRKSAAMLQEMHLAGHLPCAQDAKEPRLCLEARS